jgi:hypothetical protein
MRRIDKNINMKKVNLLTEERYNNLKGLITEGNEPFSVYHKSYGSAIDAIGDYAASLGFELDMEEYRNTYLDAFFKPKPGETKRDSLSLYKSGKEQSKMLHVQIYNMGESGTFELNMYVN